MIINSLLDNDLYKFSMMQAIYHQFSDVEVEYEFKCRSGENLIPYIVKINNEMENYCSLKFNEDELRYLQSIKFFKKDFIDFLRLYQPNLNHIKYGIKNEEFFLTIKGSWLLTVLMEVPLLAIISEVYSSFNYLISNDNKAHKLLLSKIDIVNNTPGFKFADFGTRRRFTYLWHKRTIRILTNYLKPNQFVGTSNVLFAKEFNTKPIGTMAHEWIMAGQQITRTADSQKYMLQKWVDEYRGDLGIALTDTIGIDAFLNDFDSYFAKLYDGVRHDSGDAFRFAIKMIDHYDKLKIDAKTKTIVFSDGLNFKKAQYLNRSFGHAINVSFGIGTNLTNDVPGIKPLSIVIKMQKFNGHPVAKISDTPEKIQCQDIEYLNYLKRCFKIK